MFDNFEEILSLLPKGWEEAARSENALCRKGRYIKTPRDLLQVIFFYLIKGKTFGQTAIMLQLGEYPLTKNAIYERVTESADWLKWMCVHLCRENRFIFEKPDWLENYRVCFADATSPSAPGRGQMDHRLHYLIDLFSLQIAELHVTNGAEAEAITRHETLHKNDLVIGGRVYSTLKGIRYVQGRGADYLFRMKANPFKMYTAAHEEFHWEPYLEDWTHGRGFDLCTYYRSGAEYYPIRIIASLKTPEETEQSALRVNASDSLTAFNRFDVIMTSLSTSVPPEQVWNLYWMMCRIEYIFRRFKAVFTWSEPVASNEKTFKACFYGKLLLAALFEIRMGRTSLPPADK